MAEPGLTQAALFLGASAIAAPLAKKLRIGSVLGYLGAGVLIGPFGIGLIYSVYDVENILHIAEFGIVLLLFIIGLELRPLRLWSMRQAVFGLGGAQVGLTAIVLSICGFLLGLTLKQAIFVGLALSLSSTAFALQILEEKGELKMRHGRLAFSILLFQDLAAIPMIAMVPLFIPAGVESGTEFSAWFAIWAIATILFIIVVGRFLLNRIYRIVAATKVKEAMTASALLTVVGVALLMQYAGLSAALGAFIAGALLADSEYRHEIEANIAPFEGLLLGLFFTAIGMNLNLHLLIQEPLKILFLVALVLVVKITINFGLGRAQNLDPRGARRMAISVSQDGEFAFVLLTSAVALSVVEPELAALLSVVVTLTMVSTPILLGFDDLFKPKQTATADNFDEMPEDSGHVIIAGFGRFGQIVARILSAKRISFTALDSSSERVDFVKRFGSKIYYGDPARPDILRAAKADQAKCFILAIDDVEDSLKVAASVRHSYPDLPVFARARDRLHVHKLMDLGVQVIFRETFYSALKLSQEVLVEYGLKESEAERLVETFRAHDQKRLYDDYEHFTDVEKLRLQAKKSAQELEDLFEQDLQEPLLDELNKVDSKSS